MADVKNIKIKVSNNFKQTGRDAEGMNKKLNKTSKASSSLASSVGSAVKGLFNMQNLITGFAVGAVVAGVSAIAGVFTSLVTTFSGFSKELSGLQAILGASAADMGKLSDQAKQLGASTQFTAKEVVQLQTELAKLGFTTKEIQQSTEATLNLASSLDVGLAESAMLAGSTLKAFGLDASETARVVDVMAKSSASSALDFSGLQESLKLVAPTSRALNVSVEETTAMLGILADNGLKGSIAGTGLSKTFIQLTKSGIPLKDALEKVKNSSNQLNTAVELVGIVGAKSLLTLANNAPKIDKLTETLNNAGGSAKALAETRLDNLSGDTTKLKSAWEGFLLSIEDGSGAFSKMLRGIVQATTAFLGMLGATQKESEAIEEQRLKLFMYQAQLNDANLSQEDRVKIVNELQEQYPDYLSNIDAETASNEELADAINRVNENLVTKAIMARKEEQLKEQADKTAEAFENKFKAEGELVRRVAQLVKAGYGDVIKEGDDVITQARKIAEESKRREAKTKTQKRGGREAQVTKGIVSSGLLRQIKAVTGATEEYEQQQRKGNVVLSERDAMLKAMGITEQKQEKKVRSSTKSVEAQTTARKGLIQALKDQISALSKSILKETDEEELAVKNQKLKALQQELKVLQELGVEKEKTEGRLALEKKANEFSIQFTQETSDKRLRILVNEAQTAYNESVRLNEKRIQKEDDQNKLRISLIKDDAEREKEQLILSYNDKFAIAEGSAELEIELKKRLEAELNAIDKKSKDEQAVRDKKLNAQKVGIASDGFGALSELVMSFEAKDKESAKRQFKVNKALQIGQTVASTASGIMNQLAVPQDALTGLNFVKAGIVAATGAASLVKIAGSKFDEGSTGGSPPEIASGGGSQAPNFNVVGNSGINQIAQLQNEPTRAYVVSGEVTSQQALDRNRQMNATL